MLCTNLIGQCGHLLSYWLGQGYIGQDRCHGLTLVQVIIDQQLHRLGLEWRLYRCHPNRCTTVSGKFGRLFRVVYAARKFIQTFSSCEATSSHLKCLQRTSACYILKRHLVASNPDYPPQFNEGCDRSVAGRKAQSRRDHQDEDQQSCDPELD
jgi:hypothetical protein